MGILTRVFTLASALGLNKTEIVAAYGAGGKTSVLRCLAEELVESGLRVLLTTTTAMYPPPWGKILTGRKAFAEENSLENLFYKHQLVVWGREITMDGKLMGVEPQWIEEWLGRDKNNLPDIVLVEADGARSLYLKGYAYYEPVIPPPTTLLLPVLGWQGLGSLLDEKTVHRAKLFALQTGFALGSTLDVDTYLAGYKFMIKRGLGQAPDARVVPIANQTEGLPSHFPWQLVAGELSKGKKVNRILFTSFYREPRAQVVMPNSGSSSPRTAGVVMAAGSSKRMGTNKLFLELEGKTVLEHTVERALASGCLEDVVVVVKPEDSAVVRKLFSSPQVTIVENLRHEEGLSTTLQCGLTALHPLTQGALFILGDQPDIPPVVYRKVVESYQESFSLVVTPTYQGNRGNPVLFDRRLWKNLMEIHGDQGGRELLHNLSSRECKLIEVGTPSILQDLDTPEDYHRRKQ